MVVLPVLAIGKNIKSKLIALRLYVAVWSSKFIYIYVRIHRLPLGALM